MGGNGRYKTFSYYERQQIKQCVIEAEVQRFSREETIAYIKSRIGLEVSPETVSNAKHSIGNGIKTRVINLQKDRFTFLSQFFKRIDEIEKYQKELWVVIHTQGSKDGYLKRSCIAELHQLTITLANLYELLPEYCGGSTYYAPTKTATTKDNGEIPPTIEVTARKPIV